MSEDEKIDFIGKMTKINKKRCSSEEFKEKISKVVTKQYIDEKERKIQSKRIKNVWNNSELREKQSIKIKKFHDSNPNYLKGLHTKPCSMILNNE
jgi:predicted ATPase with chaperone activity